jgi:putative lipoprotein
MRPVFAALMLAACASSPVELTEGVPAELSDTQWMRIDDEDAGPHFPVIAFDSERAFGFGGCNRFFASIEHAGERIAFGPIGATRMMCAESSMQTERNMFNALERTRAFRIDGEVLTLLDNRGAEVGRFEALTAAERPPID